MPTEMTMSAARIASGAFPRRAKAHRRRERRLSDIDHRQPQMVGENFANSTRLSPMKTAAFRVPLAANPRFALAASV